MTELFSSIWQDVRVGLRGLRRASGFSVAIVLTLALGIGASTALFSIVRGVLLRPLPYAEPDRLVRIWEVSPAGDDHNVVSSGNYTSWRTQVKSFAAMGMHSAPVDVSLVLDGEPSRVVETDVTPSAMRTLGVRAALGRNFMPDDERGDGHVVVLSHDFWQRQFGSDSAVIGRTLMLNEAPCTIVGVMPAAFEFPESGVDLWRALADDHIDPNERRSHNFYVIARLAPGVSLRSAQTEMQRIRGALALEYPQFMKGFGTNVVGMADDVIRTIRPVILLLMAGATLLLVVACANIANLLLARALGRQREIAVRGALGASTGRLARQLLTETTVVALVGGALGTALAAALTRALVAIAPSDIPRLSAVHVDAAVLTYAMALTVLSGLAVGLAPAARLLASRRGSSQTLHSALRTTGDRGTGRQGRARALLLVGELAVSFVLLAGAGLLLRSAYRLSTIDYGYRVSGLTAASFDLPRLRYDGTDRHIAFYDRLIDGVSQLPHVSGVTGTSESFGSAASMTFSFAIQGRPSRNASGREDPQPLRVVTTDYFRVLGIPLRRGRTFTADDRAGSPPVVIVNESLARLLWPSLDPVGARISFAGPAGPWLDVVGVVGDTRSSTADAAPMPAVYLPYAQKRWSWMSWLTLVVRTDSSTDAKTLGSAIRGVVKRLDDRLPVQEVTTVQALYRESIARRRFATILTAAFAMAALVLGTVGMYGVLSYGVVQRRREFGIRMALGAQSGQVTRVIVRDALAMAGVAVIAGATLAIALTRLFSGLLFEVSPRDPATFAAAALLVGTVAVAAAWIPARRATRIDPATTIRDA